VVQFYIRMATQKTPKNPLEYICEKCDIKCSNKKDYKRHLLTAKHQMATNGNTWQQPTSYLCECGRAYMHRASLYKHKKNAKKPQKTQKTQKTPIAHRYLWDRVPTLEKTYFSPKSLSKVRSDKNKCRFRIL
jgi:uncharacterized Zn-finger protein